MNRFSVASVSVGDWDNNAYVIQCLATREALVVDGAAEPERILGAVGGMKVVGIAQTHGHFDHVQALPALAEALAVPVYAHPAEPMPVPLTPLADSMVLRVGTLEITALHTPGHTPGSMCFLARGHLFSGDTLFPGGPGNTDGDTARFFDIIQSLDRLFEALPDETYVWPGHGAGTTIGRERPDLETWRARGW